LGEAIKLAASQEFNTKLEVQNLIQAKNNKENLERSLAPHIGYSTGLAVLSGPLDGWGVASLASDLTPFLFPSRWMQAKQGKDLEDAEKQTMVITRDAAILQVLGLAYQLHNDESTDALYLDAEAKAQTLHDLAVKGKFPQQVVDDLSSYINELGQLEGNPNGAVSADKSALAGAMGLVNPDAIIDLTIPKDRAVIAAATAIDTTNPANPSYGNLSYTDLKKLVLKVAPEINQQNAIIRATSRGVTASRFSWIDPMSDQNHELGLGLGNTVATAKSQYDEAVEMRFQIANKLLTMLYNAVYNYNIAVASRQPNVDVWLVAVDKRYAQLLSEFQSGQYSSDTTAQIAEDVINNYLNAHIAQVQNNTSYRISKATLDRLTLQGDFSNPTTAAVLP
jgi:hypothetical protein